MILLCKESEQIIKEITPNIYNRQKEIIEKKHSKKMEVFAIYLRQAFQTTIYRPRFIEIMAI
jgi:hypothetical protein